MLALTIGQEKELIGNCISGDKSSWDKFVSQYSKMVYSCIHGALRGYGRVNTPEFVDELFQEVFVALLKDDFKKLKSFGWKNGCSFSTWLKKVTGRLVQDYSKKETNRTKGQDTLDEPAYPEGSGKQTLGEKLPSRGKFRVSKQPTWMNLLFKIDEIEIIRKLVQKLSASDQLLFRLIYNDVSVEDIAKHMNKSAEAVYMQKTRVLGKLRQELQKKNVSY